MRNESNLASFSCIRYALINAFSISRALSGEVWQEVLTHTAIFLVVHFLITARLCVREKEIFILNHTW